MIYQTQIKYSVNVYCRQIKVKYLSILGQTVIDFILYSVQCYLLKDSGQICFTVELGESCRASLVAQTVKHLPTTGETQVQSLGQEDPLEKKMATHSSVLAWKIPWTEEPGRLQSMGSQRIGHDWATSLSFLFLFCLAQASGVIELLRGQLCNYTEVSLWKSGSLPTYHYCDLGQLISSSSQFAYMQNGDNNNLWHKGFCGN